MTCIVGLVDKGKVYIGGDSAAIDEQAIEVRANRKVFRKGDYLLGFTGSFRIGQLLEHSATLHKPEGELMQHMVTKLVPAVKDIAGKSMHELIVGCDGRLFKIDSSYAVAEYGDYVAAGGGEKYALGKLHGSKGAPKTRILAALDAAQAHCAGVRAPFHIEVV
ncbi:MAG: hypothetical protein EOR99_35055 [Mesorhizobium sp.]|nr:MAG: hypothetical protein EOR99_35055 [Mesorhizobium sp.]